MIVSIFIAFLFMIVFGRILYSIIREMAKEDGTNVIPEDVIAALIICIVVFVVFFASSHFLITPAIGYFLPVVETVERYRLEQVQEDRKKFMVNNMPFHECYSVKIKGKKLNIPLSTKIRVDDKSPIRMLKKCKREFAKKWYKWIARSIWLKKSWNEIVLVSKNDITHSITEGGM